MAPLLAPLGWIYFFFAFHTVMWSKVYAEEKKPDTGGDLWILALKQMFWGLALFVIIMAGVLSELDNHWPATCTLGAITVVIWGQNRFEHFVFDGLPLEYNTQGLKNMMSCSEKFTGIPYVPREILLLKGYKLDGPNSMQQYHRR